MSSTTSRKMQDGSGSGARDGHGTDAPSGGMGAKLAIAWTIVGVPLAYGIYETAKKASALFTG